MHRAIFTRLCRKPYGVGLSSWSNLSAAFNSRPNNKRSRLKSKGGLFNVPELHRPEGFHDLRYQCVVDTNSLVEEAVNGSRGRKMVEIFDELSNNLCKVADLAEFVRLAHPDEAYVEAAEGACAAVSGLVEKLNTDKRMYDALKNVVSTGDSHPTDAIDDLVARLFLFDFEQSGIHLSEELRNKVVSLNEVILHLGQQFVSGSSNPRKINKKHVPAFIQYAFAADGDSILVSGLHSESPNPAARELAYRVFLYPDRSQEEILSYLLESRHDLAITCGFETYAQRALNGAMFQKPEVVMEFLNRLSESLKERAQGDFNIMSAMKSKEAPLAGPLAAWDVPYYTQKYKRQQFHFSPSDYSPYFSLGACMDGLNIVFTNLYGISLELTELGEGEAWIEDVYKLAVMHETEGLLGYIYCDFYEREGKPNQDCHFTIRGGKILKNGDYQLPVVVLMLNLPLPRWSSPSLLTPSMVDNLFHEMGHAMHSMLARTSYQHVTGTRCSTDFAEVPSVLMEYFARDPRVIKSFAKHFQTNEEIPQRMLDKLCASKHVFKASEMQVQLFYSTLDQYYHGKHPLQGSTTDILAKVHEKYYGLPYIEHTAWQLRFSHLVGYGAKYYSYLVSTAVASCIWHTYFEKDPLNRTQGERYRKECLAHGGGKPAFNLVADFLQKDPTPNLLVNSLIYELDQNTAK